MGAINRRKDGKQMRWRTAAVPSAGPADVGRWADVILSHRQTLAPSASFGDLASFATTFAQMVARGRGAEAIEPLFVRWLMAALRSRALRLLGNGVHPWQPAYAWRSLAAAHGLVPVDLGAAAKINGTRIAANVAVRWGVTPSSWP